MMVARVASGTVDQPSEAAARAGISAMTSLTTSRGSFEVTRCTGPTTMIDVVVSFSAHDLPTHSSTSPGSTMRTMEPVSYTHLRAHETRHDLVCRLLLE